MQIGIQSKKDFEYIFQANLICLRFVKCTKKCTDSLLDVIRMGVQCAGSYFIA